MSIIVLFCIKQQSDWCQFEIKIIDMGLQAMTVRLDSKKKSEFDMLCEQFGMSANTAINIFVNAVVRSRSIPFTISVSDQTLETTRKKAKDAFASIREKSELSKDAEMTLDEINEEIRLYRKEK
ncbi:MAG: type II toxin-antitoxin system RelB/DinJ family antitoxin [Paludibacteraceae bacterium]|nr:type II toxin-antitoxin system RelB/DinJ family antitoxin [Paludibacteraceae bacterium]